MDIQNWEELRKNCPIQNGKWNKDYLYNYLVWSCCKNFSAQIDDFFRRYKKDEALAELLFDFLFDEDDDGSDSQMGSARYIAGLDKELLRKKKELLLKAQENKVKWKRPFPHDEYLEWL